MNYRVNLNNKDDRRAMKKLIKREQRAGNISKGVDARAAVEAMRQAQDNGQFFDNTGHVWTPTQVQQVQAEPIQMESVQMMGIPQMNLSGLAQINPVQQPKKRKRPTQQIVKEEYSRSNPHPRYHDVPSEPYKAQQSSPQRGEWFQYGVGSNAAPDKSPDEIEADRLEMNKRVATAFRNFLWGIPNYHYIGGYDTNIDGKFL